MKLKNYIYLSVILLILSGCSFKSNVDYYSQSLYHSPNLYAKALEMKLKSKLPITHKDENITMTLRNIYAKENTIIGEIDSPNKKEDILELIEKTFCKKQVKTRAFIEYGINMEYILFNKNKTNSSTIKINKSSCAKSFPLSE